MANTNERFLDRLAELASKSPNKVAVTYESEKITFADLCKKNIYKASSASNLRRTPVIGDTYLDILLQILSVWHNGGVPAILPKHPSIDLSASIRQNEEKDGLTKNESLILSTSGTTGYPKAVALPESSIISNVTSIAQQMELSDHETMLVSLPLTHSYGLIGNVLMGLYNGAHVILFPAHTPPPVLQKCLREKDVTVIQGPPSLFHLFKSYWNGRPFELIKAITTGSDKINAVVPSIVQSLFPNAKRQVIYGQTEAGPRISHFSLDDPRVLTGCVGSPLPHIEWELRDRETDPEQKILYIKGPSIMNGYITMDGGFESVPGDGFHCTNDLAQKDDDGRLYIKGRADSCFKVGGRMVNPFMVEMLIQGMDGVELVYCHPQPHDLAGFIPVVDIVKKNSTSITVKDVLEYCSQKLAPHEIPKVVNFCEALPLTLNGKIKRS